MSGISPEKRSICVSSSVALGRPVRHYYRGDCLERFGWADSTRTSRLGPNQEETAKWLKSRSTSQPPPRPPPSLLLLHLPGVTVTSIPHSTLLLSLSCFLCLSRCSSPSPVSDRCCLLIVVSSIVSIWLLSVNMAKHHGKGVWHLHRQWLTLFQPGGHMQYNCQVQKPLVTLMPVLWAFLLLLFFCFLVVFFLDLSCTSGCNVCDSSDESKTK